ncbi:SDR family NAD(P)-dependent oxidoreductase [Pseudomonas umsongensis]|uniref:SDR family NAD(P)-dependent oxidoreductase n=1 Tax=Pseudomonas umsongensis TaxID=198618 RepID=UPI00200A288D|nr:glucose 1-dehydrogenase [Pseudomonas umsongensis]MCK8683277.1 glucose 1-dehydrogenase [Pseudomonas umsongensis]
MNRLEGKVAIVTGAARGLGAATAQVLAREGAKVLLTDVLLETGLNYCAMLAEQGHEAVFCEHDVTSESDWDRVMSTALEHFGRIDILVNNAGIQLPQTIEEMSLADFRRVLDVNLVGCFLGTQRAIRQMKNTGGGAIVNIASNSTQTIVPLTTAYSPSKAAVANLSKVAALHCAKEGYAIRVNSVHPGPCETDMLTGGDARAADIPQVRQLIDAIPLKRMGRPSEVGEVVAFLASDAASYVTAAELFVDGGLTASMMK